MPPFVETILYIFLLIGFGYGAAAIGLLRETTGDGLSDFVYVIGLPMLLFRTMVFSDFGNEIPWGLWIAYFSAVAVTWTVSHGTVRMVFGRDRRAGVVAGVTGAFSNLVILGAPFVLGIYGENGLALMSLIIAIHLPTMMAASIVLFEWAVRADGVETAPVGIARLVRGFFAQLFRNPLIIGIFCGLAVRFSGLPVPSLAERLINALAGVAAPLALFSMGVGLRRFGVAGQVGAGVALAALKLMLMPTVALAMALLLGLPPFTAKIVVACAALPAGVNAWLIATRFNTGQRLASTATTIGTASAFATTAFWLAVAHAVFGP